MRIKAGIIKQTTPGQRLIRPILRSTLVLSAIFATMLPGLAGRHERSVDARPQVEEALAPYLAARAYKGTRTTTVSSRNDSKTTEVTCSLQVRCDETGHITRLRAELLTWNSDPADKASQQHLLICFDGVQWWVQRLSDRHFTCLTLPSLTLAAALGFPPAGLKWTTPPRGSNESSEREITAASGKDRWTLTVDAITGQLRSMEARQLINGKRARLTSMLHDIALGEDADVPDSRFALGIRDEFQEDKQVQLPEIVRNLFTPRP